LNIRVKGAKQNKKNNGSKINYNNNHNNKLVNIDVIDEKIIELLIANHDNSSISQKLDIPFSTIGRRTRRILQSGIITQEYQLNFNLLGMRKGLLHIYLRDGQIQKTAEMISEMEGILSVTIHAGNSDIVSEIVYYNSKESVKIIAAIKQIEGVEKVIWSEEVSDFDIHKEKVLKSFQKYWKEEINYENSDKRNFVLLKDDNSTKKM
jgi:DNA-binding Lrp family transcriptional regulator